jgi:hypothetical protein
LNGAPRTLANQITSNTPINVERCLNLCTLGGFGFCGVEFGQECWADNEINPAAGTTNISACSDACVGNTSEFCGGSNALDVYETTPPVQAANAWQIEVFTSTDCSGTPIQVLDSIGDCATNLNGQSFNIVNAPVAPSGATPYIVTLFFNSANCVVSSTRGSITQLGASSELGCTPRSVLSGTVQSISVTQGSIING